MFKIITITCKQANEICNKAQYNEASFFEKIKLNIHITICKVCALYSKQNKILTKTLGYKAKDCSLQKFNLSDEEKQRLKEKLKKEFN